MFIHTNKIRIDFQRNHYKLNVMITNQYRHLHWLLFRSSMEKYIYMLYMDNIFHIEPYLPTFARAIAQVVSLLQAM